MAERKRTTSSVLATTMMMLMMMTTFCFLTVRSMDVCGTTSAICKFNGRLQGSIIIREQEKNRDCISSGNDDPGLNLDIDLHGLDPVVDKAIGYSLEVKSYAGMGRNCSRMGPDFKHQNSGISNLGTYAGNNGVGNLQLSGVVVGDKMSLGGPSSILGRSLAFIKEDPSQEQASTVVDCCIIGMVHLPQRSSTPSPSPSPPPINHVPTFPKPAGNFNTPITTINDNNYNKNSNYRPFPVSARFSGNSGGRRFFSGGSPFSASGTAFNVDNKLSNFLNPMSKTSRVHSFSPDRVQDRFRAPEPPRFQDIFGLEVGDSPLSRSGYGNSARPSSSRGSSLSRLFFEDQGLQDALSMGLTPEEMNIPRESGREESSKSFHEDTAENDEDQYPNDVGTDADNDSGEEFGQGEFNQEYPSKYAVEDQYLNDDDSDSVNDSGAKFGLVENDQEDPSNYADEEQYPNDDSNSDAVNDSGGRFPGYEEYYQGNPTTSATEEEDPLRTGDDEDGEALPYRYNDEQAVPPLPSQEDNAEVS